MNSDFDILNDLALMFVYNTNLSSFIVRDNSCSCVFNSLLYIVRRVNYVVLYTINHFPLKENTRLLTEYHNIKHHSA